MRIKTSIDSEIAIQLDLFHRLTFRRFDRILLLNSGLNIKGTIARKNFARNVPTNCVINFITSLIRLFHFIYLLSLFVT